MKNQPASTLLFIVSVCIAFSSATFAKSLDLSDRNRDFQYRIFYDPNDLLEGCQENFSDEPCRNKVHAFVMGPGLRNPVSSKPLVNLPNAIHNQVVADFSDPSRNCTPDDRTELAKFLEIGDEKTNETTVLVVPYDLFHCFSVERRSTPEREKLFLLKAHGYIVGQIRCRTPDSAPNPTCIADYFPSNGRYTVSVGPIVLRNLRKIIYESPAIVEGFLSGVPIPFPSDFIWLPMPANVSFSTAAEQVISEYEAEYE